LLRQRVGTGRWTVMEQRIENKKDKKMKKKKRRRRRKRGRRRKSLLIRMRFWDKQTGKNRNKEDYY